MRGVPSKQCAQPQSSSPKLIELLPELRPTTDSVSQGTESERDAGAFGLPAHAGGAGVA